MPTVLMVDFGDDSQLQKLYNTIKKLNILLLNWPDVLKTYQQWAWKASKHSNGNPIKHAYMGFWFYCACIQTAAIFRMKLNRHICLG